MTMRNMRNALVAVLVAALLGGILLAAPVLAQNVACYMQQGGAKWVAGSGCEWELQAGSTLDVQSGAIVNFGGDVSVSDDLTVIGDAIVGGTLWTARGTQTVIADGWITPTATFMQLSAAGAVSTGNILTGTVGQRLTLLNGVNQTITISDTGWLKLSGNIALGQYDTLELISDGSNWIQLATSNN